MAARPDLPKELWCLIRDFMAPVDLYYFHEASPMTAALISLECAIKACNSRMYSFWQSYDSDFLVYFSGIKLGKVYMPSTKRLLRILNHGKNEHFANVTNEVIGCDFCHTKKATYFSSTRGLLLCCPKCPLRTHTADEVEQRPVTWLLTELTDSVKKCLNSDKRSAAHLEWWQYGQIIYTSAEPAFDGATGERVGCTITKNDVDSMKTRTWSEEKLESVLPDVDLEHMTTIFEAIIKVKVRRY